jgi:hypothetical protein
MAKKTRPCARCGTMIPQERLQAVPQTRLCVQCSRETGGDVKLRVNVRKLRKPGSLKGTGLDIDSVQLVRQDVPPLDP